jgi:hypothetical protein
VAGPDVGLFRETFLDSGTELLSLRSVGSAILVSVLFLFLFDPRLRPNVIQHSSAVHMVRVGFFVGSLRFGIGMPRLLRPVN